jgi:hypothetical protein
MPLEIKYSIGAEKQRIWNAIKNLSWYKKLGYVPCFPKNINPETDSLEKIYATLRGEYKEKDYKKAAAVIRKKFSKIENNFYSRIQKVCGKKIRKNYKLVITKYGVGGSYAPPNKIIININAGSPINTLLHEITHLAIEPYIQKYKIKQNEKERIVDLILISEPVSLNHYKMQKRGKEYKVIDPLFKKYFNQPIGEFFKRLKNIALNNMTLSSYHQKYADQTDEEIRRRADAKEQELATIFNEISLNTKSDPVRIAVLGCGDRRFIGHHKRIFEEVLKRGVEIITFDIMIDHLEGEQNVFRHDCTLPLPNPPYDITYAHVLLKFIETKKQFDVLKNSFDALKPGSVAIHVFDWEEVKAEGPKLLDGLWAVPLGKWKKQLTELGIEYKEIILKYGPALVLLRK